MERATEMDLPYLNYLFSEVFDKTKDDGTYESKRYNSGQIVMDPNVWIVRPVDGVAFIARPLNSTTYEAHIVSLLDCGEDLIAIGEYVIKWFFEENKTAEKLVAFVPDHRRDVKLYCISCGYKREGIMTKSFKKDGQLLDQTIYGLSREDIWL